MKAEVFLKHGTNNLPSSELSMAPRPEGVRLWFEHLWTSGPSPASWPSLSLSPSRPPAAVPLQHPSTFPACAPHGTIFCSQDHGQGSVPGTGASVLAEPKQLFSRKLLQISFPQPLPSKVTASSSVLQTPSCRSLPKTKTLPPCKSTGQLYEKCGRT